MHKISTIKHQRLSWRIWKCHRRITFCKSNIKLTYRNVTATNVTGTNVAISLTIAISVFTGTLITAISVLPGTLFINCNFTSNELSRWLKLYIITTT